MGEIRGFWRSAFGQKRSFNHSEMPGCNGQQTANSGHLKKKPVTMGGPLLVAKLLKIEYRFSYG